MGEVNMKSRIRTRTYGSVRGRGQPPLLLDSCLTPFLVHLLLEPIGNSLEKGIHAFSFRYAQFLIEGIKDEGTYFKVDINLFS